MIQEIKFKLFSTGQIKTALRLNRKSILSRQDSIRNSIETQTISTHTSSPWKCKCLKTWHGSPSTNLRTRTHLTTLPWALSYSRKTMCSEALWFTGSSKRTRMSLETLLRWLSLMRLHALQQSCQPSRFTNWNQFFQVRRLNTVVSLHGQRPRWEIFISQCILISLMVLTLNNSNSWSKSRPKDSGMSIGRTKNSEVRNT